MAFIGKTDRERKKENDFFGELFGDMVLYGIKSSYTAIAARLRR